MDIISRNFFRLLRAGVFRRQEPVEAMSASKWRKLWQLTKLHGVEAETWEGVKVLQGQFFMRLTDDLWAEWELSAQEGRTRRYEIPQLMSRRLVKKLEKMETDDGKDSPMPARICRVLRSSAVLAQCLLTADRWVRQLLLLGQTLQREGISIDRSMLEDGADRLGIARMLQLECQMLVTLLEFDKERIPLELPDDSRNERIVDEIVTAMMWQTKPWARYMKYYPTESIATLFASFIQSLINIEE